MRLVKCIVADLVVDISFDTLGGLCTVAFLEAVDQRVGLGHLFKRSIVLVGGGCRAWGERALRCRWAHSPHIVPLPATPPQPPTTHSK